jgi:hypothetical protein
MDKAMETLIRYKEEAAANNWDVYGVKFTHILQDSCWGKLGPLFKAVWPDAQYIVQVRHPLGIVMSLERDKAKLSVVPDSWITPDEILVSWMSTFAATKELAQAGAIILLYPDVFLTGKIKTVVKKLGLKWDKTADIFDKKEFSIYTTHDFAKFKRLYPEAGAMFEELKSYA